MNHVPLTYQSPLVEKDLGSSSVSIRSNPSVSDSPGQSYWEKFILQTHNQQLQEM